MSFDNKYPNRKDYRRKYEGKTSKNFDRTCRNHGDCPWCKNNRQLNKTKVLNTFNEQIKEFENDHDS